MERRLQAGFEIGERAGHIIGPDVQRSDHVADRAHRLEEPVKSPEETEKDQHPNQVARGLARFVEPRCDPVQQGLQRGRRQTDTPALLRLQHPGHRPEEPRRRLTRRRIAATGFVVAKVLDPPEFGIERQHLAENINDAGDQNAEDDAVDCRVAHERIDQGAPEQRGQSRHEHQKQNHPNQKTA